MEQDERMDEKALTDSGKQAGGSHYLECNGIERFVVTDVTVCPKIHRNHRPWNTQERCLQDLVDDVNKRAYPTTFDEVRTVVEQCIAKGWVEWGHDNNGEHVLRRTPYGNQACGYGADGNEEYPTPTITDAKAAMRILLEILYQAKHDPQLRYRGDPRVKDREAGDLDTWARYKGVSRDAFREAETECLGEGFIVGMPCYGGSLYRITSRGERFLRGEPASHSTPVDKLIIAKAPAEQPPGRAESEDCTLGSTSGDDLARSPKPPKERMKHEVAEPLIGKHLRKPRAKRGRKMKTDPQADARIADAWASGQYRTFADLDQELDLPSGSAKQAIDRHRKRKKPLGR